MKRSRIPVSWAAHSAKQGEVVADTLWRLGVFYVPVLVALWLAVMAALSRYRLSRDDHEHNLCTLAAARAADLLPAIT